nr:MAG TPA: hypothetical protein [Caudoviricetes sp.]DAZ25772.1 MAG TPA: hypothetical protein [Caudoviricetes sp.]
MKGFTEKNILKMCSSVHSFAYHCIYTLKKLTVII